MAKRNSEHIGFVSLSRQPATADWTVATIKLAMEQEPEGDIEAVLNYVACKAKHRFGVRLHVTRASPGRPPIDDTEVVTRSSNGWTAELPVGGLVHSTC